MEIQVEIIAVLGGGAAVRRLEAAVRRQESAENSVQEAQRELERLKVDALNAGWLTGAAEVRRLCETAVEQARQDLRNKEAVMKEAADRVYEARDALDVMTDAAEQAGVNRRRLPRCYV